jgi:hypothetical protein
MIFGMLDGFEHGGINRRSWAGIKVELTYKISFVSALSVGGRKREKNPISSLEVTPFLEKDFEFVSYFFNKHFCKQT